MSRIALATVVTQRAVPEFLILKRSVELCHGTTYEWFVRCDARAYAALAGQPHLHCVELSCARETSRGPLAPDAWRGLMLEKMHAIDDAWRAGGCDAVVYLDSDIIAISPFLEHALQLGGQVVLSPHHRPPTDSGGTRPGDRYNGGFLLTRDRNFHHWWRAASDAEPSHMADQTCLTRVAEQFDVKEMGLAANVGWWRGGDMWSPPAVPADCQFVHVHLYQDAYVEHELCQKRFALTCVEFLAASPKPEHRLLFNAIVALDRTGYYATLLRERVAVLTACEPQRAIRLLLMARTLPAQVEVRCVCHGSPEAFERRLNGAPLPSNVSLRFTGGANDANGVNAAAREWLLDAGQPTAFVFPVDIDYVFPVGFWYTFCAAREVRAGRSGAVCPVPLRDPDGRFLWYQFWYQYHGLPARAIALGDGQRSTPPSAAPADIVAWESARTHYIPLTASLMVCAEPAFQTAPPPLRHFDPNVPACIEVENPWRGDAGQPWPGLLIESADFRQRLRPDSLCVATNSFLFHLWHPEEQESTHAGWYARDVDELNPGNVLVAPSVAAG